MKWASFDVETGGVQPMYALQPFRAMTNEAWLNSWAVAWENGPGGEPILASQVKPSAHSAELFLESCAMNGTTICGWNVAFDVAWLIALGLRESVYKCKFLDGMLLWRHLRVAPTFEYQKGDVGFGLKAAVAQFYPEHAGYNDNVTFNPETPEEWDQLVRYNEQDAAHTLNITRKLWDMLSSEQKRVAMVEAACIPLVAETMVQGVHANLHKATQLSQTLEDASKLAFVQLKLSSPDVTKEVLASPKQLSKLLTETWRIPAAKFTDKGQVSTDREALAYMAVHDPRAALVNEYREATANRTKFSQGVVESLIYNGDGNVRPQHRIFGTYTGRMTISSSTGKNKDEVPTGVALHQWKRDPAFRSLIEPPEGYDLAEFDFAGQEFRWMAVCSGDETMLELCQPGQDAHAYMAAQIERVDYSLFMRKLSEGDKDYKAKRQLGKVANLSLQYRTSANKLQRVAAIQHGIKLTSDDAKLIHSTYQRTYRKVPAYWKQQKHLAKRQNYIENLAGRRIYFKEPYERGHENDWSYDSTAVNYPIQSMGAEQKYLALMVLRTMLPRWGARFYFELHDGLFVIIPHGCAGEAVPEIKQALSNLPYSRAFKLDLPIGFPVDAKVGPSWGELKEVK
jgi:DNA polymerase I-like protein with 3'-5' exonuclease and polymerase domains